MKQVFVLGQGKTLIGSSSFHGAPCLVLCEAPEPRKVGDAGDEHAELLDKEGVAIVFATAESVFAHVRATLKSVEKCMRANGDTEGADNLERGIEEMMSMME